MIVKDNRQLMNFQMSRAIVEQLSKNKRLKALIINTFSLYVVSNKLCHQELSKIMRAKI